MRPQRPVQPGVGVARGVPEREAGRRIVLLERLAEFEEARGVLREFLEAGLLHRGDAVVDQAAGGGDRDADPFVAGLAVGLGGRRPAAVLLAEVVGDIGHVHALRREQVRQRIEAPHHVEALAGVGDHRGLRLDVLERLVGHHDIDAGGLLEGVDHLHEGLVFRFTKRRQRIRLILAPFSGFQGAACAQALAQSSKAGSGECSGGRDRGAALHHGAASEHGHGRSSLCVVIVSRCPEASSNRWTSRGSGLSRILSPGLNW